MNFSCWHADSVLHHHQVSLTAIHKEMGIYVKLAPFREGGAGNGARMVGDVPYSHCEADEERTGLDDDELLHTNDRSVFHQSSNDASLDVSGGMQVGAGSDNGVQSHSDIEDGAPTFRCYSVTTNSSLIAVSRYFCVSVNILLQKIFACGFFMN
jgi:hypothetical protein